MARMGELKSIRMLEKETGLKTVQDGITAIVSAFVLSFNLGKEMSSPQVQHVANMIIIEKKHLSIQDIQLCFRRAQTGVYGKIYDRMDIGVVFDFLNAYEAEKSETAEIQSIQDHGKFLGRKTDTEVKAGIDPDSQKVIDEIKSRLDAQLANEREEKRKKLASKRVPVISETYLEIKEKEFRDQFYRLFYSGWGLTSAGQKFVKRFKKNLSEDEFMKIKVKQHDKVIKYAEQRRIRNNH